MGWAREREPSAPSAWDCHHHRQRETQVLVQSAVAVLCDLEGGPALSEP